MLQCNAVTCFAKPSRTACAALQGYQLVLVVAFDAYCNASAAHLAAVGRTQWPTTAPAIKPPNNSPSQLPTAQASAASAAPSPTQPPTTATPLISAFTSVSNAPSLAPGETACYDMQEPCPIWAGAISADNKRLSLR